MSTTITQCGFTTITQYGFTMGPATVTRIHQSAKFGALLEVSGQRERIEIRATPSGLIRVSKVIKRVRK